MLRQLEITARQLASRPAFTLSAIATLAIGVGAATAVFSTVNATLLRPLPYPDAEEIYTLSTEFEDGRWTSGRLAGAYFTAVNEHAPSVERAAVVWPSDAVVLTDDGPSRPVRVHSVSEGFFELFGLSMAEGRAPEPEDGRVAVLSHDLWEELFGRDPDVVGGSLRLANAPAPVVGVAPPELDLPDGPDVWLAFTPPPAAVAHVYRGYLRAAPGTTPERLRSELDGAMARVVEEHPSVSGRRFVVEPLLHAIVGDLGTILLVVLAGAVLLLVLGCVNVATLILARGVTRAKDSAVRAALGASRWHIAGRFLNEAFLLSAAGTLAGLLLAWVGVRLLLAFGAAELPRLDQVPFDGRVLLIAAVALAAATVLVALLPAVRLSNPDIRGLLNEGGRGASGGRGMNRLLSGLVVLEMALAVTLAAGGGWLVRSYVNVAETDPGFEAQGRLLIDAHLAGSRWIPLMTMTQTPDGPVFETEVDAGRPQDWREAVVERLLALEPVTAVGAVGSFPLRPDRDVGLYVGVPGEPFDEDRQDTAFNRPVSPEFFEAAGVRFVRGRNFEPGDPAVNTAIVNEAFVRRFLSGKDPLTTPFAAGFPVVNLEATRTIVGVVEDVRYRRLTEPADPAMYTPGAAGQRQTLVVATTLEDPAELISVIRDAVRAVDPAIPIGIESVPDLVAAELVRHRLGLLLMVVFALASLALAAIGIYGVIAHSTAQRRRELATRIALGAMPEHVVRLLLLRGALVGAVGIGAGLAVSLGAGRLAASRLHGVHAVDVAILGSAIAAVLAITLAAHLLPALRASRVPPTEALRAE